MAVIHQTTVKPSKLELLTAWLPSRSWYLGGGEPELAKGGGFRLDDPEGEVGMEVMVVTDTAAARPVTYLAPLTYRGAPLDGAEHALVGTMEHGVLGRRWIYDGAHDPVLVAQLLALIEGRAQAQAQNVSDTPDHDVTHALVGDAPAAAEFASATVVDGQDGTTLTASSGAILLLHRVLHPVEDESSSRTDAAGTVVGAWSTPDGSRVRSLFVEVRPAPAV